MINKHQHINELACLLYLLKTAPLSGAVFTFLTGACAAFSPSELNAIILRHGHLDHSGYLPVLVKKGFTGPIYATAPTKDITEIED